MQIVAVLGSPRLQGNSSTIANRFLEAAGRKGAACQVFTLNKMKFKGCQGCGSCKGKTEYCVVEDDFSPVYEAIRTANVLLVASPVYFGDISGQMKCFFDRTYAFLNPDFSSRLQPGKKAVVILTQGHPDPALFGDVFPRYEQWLKIYGFSEIELIRGVGLQEAGAVSSRPDVLAQAEAAVGRLVE
jgi:multimeric flavodoxin WrbA